MASSETRQLLAIKLLHTVVWAFFAGCIVAIPIFGWRGRLLEAGVLCGVVFIEVLVLLWNRWRCPLTPIAARYTTDRRDNFDIFLPEWLARHNKVIFGGLYVAGVLFVLFLAATQVPSRATVEPLAIGETFTIQSAVLGEERRINVYAPAAYTASEGQRFPVLYMPDGGIHEDFLHVAGLVQILALNEGMRPFLVVGIENTERRRDLTGPTSSAEDREIAPRVGGSADFRAFIRTELMPVINADWRTNGETAIVGESLAGLFVVETLLVEPALFDTYLAIDPSLWWDRERLVNAAVSELGKHSTEKRTLYLAASGQEGMAEPVARLAALLEAGAPQIEVVYQALPDETHLTVYHPAALAGFRKVLGR